MKSLIQDLRNGSLQMLDVPAPVNQPNHLLVETRQTLISSGTERSLRDFGRASYFQKIKKQPEKVQQAIHKVSTDGIVATYEAISTKLNDGIPLGYSNVGTVIESTTPKFKKGARVVSNGNHAEIVRVPANLCALVPDQVCDQHATFTVVGAIALQSVRLLNPVVGERVCVIGVGLVGQLCVQLLLANGCRVLAIDIDSEKLRVARDSGSEAVLGINRKEVVDAADVFSGGKGVDGVIIAATTESHEVVQNAAEISRKKGRVILVGTVGLKLRRDDFYKKELRFQVSSSYGPGRYDQDYEQKGGDYPFAFVRWTAQRNFEAVLELMALGRLQIDPLISQLLDFEKAHQAYDLLDIASTLGVILDFGRPDAKKHQRTVELIDSRIQRAASRTITPVIGFLGSGNYPARVLLPELKRSKSVLQTVVSSDGARGVRLARQFGFAEATTTSETIWNNSAIDSVIVAGKHNDHSEQVIRSLETGKNVFVEKPLAITLGELEDIEKTIARIADRGVPPVIMVDFNRRFSPLICKMKALLDHCRSPKTMIYTINAGFVPADHWVHDPNVGGGRIIGEVCHFIDLTRFLVGAPIIDANIIGIEKTIDPESRGETASISISFLDGSIATVHYFANGGRGYPKERLEVFCSGRTLQLNNFKSLVGFEWPGFQKQKLWQQNKGNRESVRAFLEAVKTGGPAPIPLGELFEVSRETIRLAGTLDGFD